MSQSLKQSARAIAYYALKIGKIKKPEVCENCSLEGRLEMHHKSYYEPLKIRWLCGRCHRRFENAKRARRH